ncbi:MAG: hypothetical protein DI536_13050 [Archangium gephyra]|uniref:Quinol:cytochrome C oxidoreductase n=1 Tax=Archangium gephyra TaxID=48 RepID=A0A2W5TCG9_9BACT|nr:MAG: hypothetical protein DI536_13050 [Archangium gephyra]
MSHHEIKKPEDIQVSPSSFLGKLPMLGAILAVAGLGATLGSSFGEHKARAMFSYLWAFEATLAIPIGALGWILIAHTVRGGWDVVVRRIADHMVGALPVFAILWIPIGLIGFHELYPWSHETDAILEKKRWFLSTGFWYARSVIYLVIWAALGFFIWKTSVKQDSMTDKGAIEKSVHMMRKVAAGGIFLYGLSLSFAAFDWVMSLSPHWYSTIFGVYYFAASILAFFAFLIIMSSALQAAGVMKEAITLEHFHDMGKLMFGYTVFWAYIAFSQFILIWYANMPEETEYYLMRLEGGWQYISYLLPVLHFFVPFLFLLSRNVKRNKTLVTAGAVWTLVLHFVDIYWLVLPNYVEGGHGGHHEPHLAPSYLDFTALIGVFGVFLAVFGFFLTRNKAVAINDPRLPESLAHENY